MKKILGIEVTDAEFNYLFSQQSKGLELHVEYHSIMILVAIFRIFC